MSEIALIGKKIGMTREFYKSGQLVPVTVLKMEKARVVDVIEESEADVFIALAGLSAALPGVVAAHTLKPVIGVPCASSSSPANLDSLLSVVQMPPGVPVAGVGIGRGENAALLAARILGISNNDVDKMLVSYRKELEQKTIDSN